MHYSVLRGYKILKAILKTFKIKHWVKNAIVFVPLIFSMNFFNLKLVLYSIIGFFAFCLISSAVYVLNDLIDIEKDKLHPIKKNRPIASGLISKKFAVCLMVLLLILSLGLGFSLNLISAIIILSYFVLNVFYSLWLKNIALIDVASIALGFVLRVLLGCSAISVVPSALVVLLTFFASEFFTFSKRKLEMKLLKDKVEYRNSIKLFDINLINQFILISAILSISFYITYVLDKTTIARIGSEFLYITVIPFSLIVFRLLFLINYNNEVDDPMNLIEKDVTLKILSLIFLATLAVIMYI